MAFPLHLCAGAYGEPRRIVLDSFAAFADTLRDVETTEDKLLATTLLPAELVADPVRNDRGEVTKTLENIEAVTTLALDFDDITEDQLLAVLSKDLRGKRWACHTTFSHAEAQQRGLWRVRVWLELERPIPAASFRAFRERFDATLSAPIDATTRNANRLMFAPCTRAADAHAYQCFDWRDFPGADTATPVAVPDDPPLTHAVAIPAPSGGSSGTANEPSEVVGLDDLRKLRDRLRRRSSKFDNQIGDYLAKVIRGEAFVTSSSHEPTLDLARVLAMELPDAAAWSLAALVEPSLTFMRRDHGSDETERGFEEKVRSWRKKKAAEKARYALPAALVGDDAAKHTPITDADIDSHDFAPDAATALDRRFGVLRRADGEHVVYDVSEGDVCIRQAGDGNMVEVVSKTVPIDEDGKRMNARKARIAIADWMPFARRIPEEPEPSRFKSDPGYCFQRLPFDLTAGQTPAWDEFTGRLSNADLFKAFIWTAFEKRCQSRQTLWIQGEGEDGKSTVMSVIREALGAAATAANADTFAHRFGLSALDGKRFAIVFDCKDTLLLMRETLRNVTSGDEVLVERKGEALETKRLNVKVVVCSNYEPDSTSSKADTSRLILLHVDPSKNRDDPTWSTRLREELPAFLADCRATYERMCPHHGKLPLSERDREAIAERVDASEEEFEDACDELLTITGNPEDVASCQDVSKALTGQGLTSKRWPHGKYAAFKRYLARRGVGTKRIAAGRVFTGAVPRRAVPKSFKGN